MYSDQASSDSRRKPLDIEQLDWIDSRVKRFEAEWHVDKRTNFENYLTDAGGLRVTLLAELAHVDLEFHYRLGRPSPLENILAEFPELAEDSRSVAELLWSEFQLRKRDDPRLNINILSNLFPKLCNQQGVKIGENSISIRSAAVGQTASHLTEPRTDPPCIPGFEFREMLGRGGMGVVYRAFDLQLQRDVAIKMLLNGSLATKQEQSQFRQEASTVAALQHPQIIQVFQVGVYEGQLFLVLEYAAYGSLAKKFAGQPLEPNLAAELLLGISRATDAIHQCGILHRDLKPSNILVTEPNTFKIADFGLARTMESDNSSSKRDSIVGTPSYSAPEYIFGWSNVSGPAQDIYSLGAILYELLTGRAPYVGSSVLDILVRIQQGEYLAPRKLSSRIPRDLENICTKCLSPLPQNRYGSAGALADDLERFLAGKTVLARPLPWTARSLRWLRLNPWIAACGASLVTLMLLLVVGFAAIILLQSRSMKMETELRTQADRLRNEAIRNEEQALLDAAAANDAVRIIEELFDSTMLAMSSNDFSQSVPQTRYSIDVSAREMIDRSVSMLRTSLNEKPLLRARLLTAIGVSALNVGQIKEARPLIAESITIYEKHHNQESLAAANSYLAIARIETEMWQYDAAVEAFEKTKSILKKQNAENSNLWADTIVYDAWMRVTGQHQGDVQHNLRSLEQALEVKKRLFGETNAQAVVAETVLVIYRALSQQSSHKAITDLEQLLAKIQATPVHPFFESFVLDQLASIHQRLNHSEQATELISKSLALMQRAIGETAHPQLIEIYSDAAWIAHCRGDELSFRRFQSQAVTMRKELIGWDHKSLYLMGELIAGLEASSQIVELRFWLDTIQCESSELQLNYRSMGVFLARMKDLETQGEFKKAWSICEEIYGMSKLNDEKDTPASDRLFIQRARLQIMMGDYEAALREYESWESKRSPRPDEWIRNIHTATLWNSLLDLIGSSNPGLSARLNAESTDASLGKALQFHQDDWPLLVEHFYRTGQIPGGRKRLERWHEEWLESRSPKHVCLGGLKSAIADCFLSEGEIDRAEQFAKEGLELLRDSLAHDADKTIDCQLILARVHVAQSNNSEAERLGRGAVAATENACGNDHPRTWYVRRQLAKILYDIGRQEDAIKIAMDSLESIRSRMGIHHPDYADSVFLAVELQYGTYDNRVVQEFFSPIVEEFKKTTPANNLPRLQMERWMEKLLSNSSSR
jgi:tetratricopeptide (TPR) repeat protein